MLAVRPASASVPNALGASSLVLRLVLASRRSSPLPGCHRSAGGGHPGRRSSSSLAPSARKPFENHNRFIDLLAFLPQLGEHFGYVHRFRHSPSDSLVRAEFHPLFRFRNRTTDCRASTHSCLYRILGIFSSLFRKRNKKFYTLVVMDSCQVTFNAIPTGAT